MSITNAQFTCVTCLVAFSDPEKQRAHYKTDWHRYNLKRKVVDMAPVSAQSFIDRVQSQKTLLEHAKKEASEELFCKLCSKHFTTRNSYSNHTQSKKHKEIEAKSQSSVAKEATVSEKKEKIAAKTAAETLQLAKEDAIGLAPPNQAEVSDEDNNEWEDIADEEIVEYDESKGIGLNTCLFCELKCDSLESKVEHMAKEHSFFIPDYENVSDLEGLMKFLGVKLGVYHVCLWCSSKCYPSLKAVQQHMADKGHLKMIFEGDTLYEYADFYTYDGDEAAGDSASDEEMAEAEEGDDEATQFLKSENYELVLPSGSRIGHRSLFRYYRQNFGHRSMDLKLRSQTTLKDKYKALGCGGGMTRQDLLTKRKDLACFQRWKSNMHVQLGWKTNSLMKHYRRQDITF